MKHSEDETAAEQIDDQEEKATDEQEDGREEEEREQGQENDREGEKDPQPHLKNSSQSHQTNRTPGDHIDPTYTDYVILVAANNFSSFKKLVKVSVFVVRFVSNVKQNKQTEKEEHDTQKHNLQTTATLSLRYICRKSGNYHQVYNVFSVKRERTVF